MKRLESLQELHRREWFYICTGERVPDNRYRKVRSKRRASRGQLVNNNDVERAK